MLRFRGRFVLTSTTFFSITLQPKKTNSVCEDVFDRILTFDDDVIFSHFSINFSSLNTYLKNCPFSLCLNREQAPKKCPQQCPKQMLRIKIPPPHLLMSVTLAAAIWRIRLRRVQVYHASEAFSLAQRERSLHLQQLRPSLIVNLVHV